MTQENKDIDLLQFKGIDYNSHYNTIVGDTPFAKEVNQIISNYWVNTGRELALEDAMWSVMANYFNKNSK